MYPKEYVKCYIDGSATMGTTDGGYGISIEWMDKETTQISGPRGSENVQLRVRKGDVKRLRPPAERTA